MKKYLYCRVSTINQNESRQLEDAIKNDIPEENIFVDKQSGKNFERTEYQKMISKLQEGDVIYFHSIDRMGRNYDDILENWRYITKELKANIVILDMPLLDTTRHNDDLTGKLIGDIVLQLLSYVAEKERDMILTRQREGIAIAKAAGKFKKKEIDMDLFHKLDADVKAGLITVVTAAQELGVTRMTFYNLRKQENEGCVC